MGIPPNPEEQLEEVDTRVGHKEKADDVWNKANNALKRETAKSGPNMCRKDQPSDGMMVGDISWEVMLTND